MMRKMNFFTLFILILDVLPSFIQSITITPKINKHPSIESWRNFENLNQTERFRRLIPYMTFYIPTANNDYFPTNQAYNIMPLSTQQQQHGNSQYQLQPQQQQQQQLILPNSQQQRIKSRPPHHQPNTGHDSYNNHINKVASNRPHVPAIVYNTRHQPNKPYDPTHHPLQSPAQQRVNYNQPKQQLVSYVPQPPPPLPTKEQLTPFLSTNQVPGKFRPVVHGNEPIAITKLFPKVDPKNQAQPSKPQVIILSTEKPFYVEPSKEENNEANQDKITPHASTPVPLPPDFVYAGQGPSAESLIEPNQEAYSGRLTHLRHQPISYNNYANFHYNLDPDDGYDIQVPYNELNNYVTPRPVSTPKPKYYEYNAVSSTAAPRPNVQLIHSTPSPTSHSNKQPIQAAQSPRTIHISQPTPQPHRQIIIQSQHRPTQSSLDYGQYDQADFSYEDEPPQPIKPTKQTLPIKQHLTETTQIQTPTLTTYRPTISTPKNYPPTYANHHPFHHPVAVATPATVIEQNKEASKHIARPSKQHQQQSAVLPDVLRKLQESDLLPQILNADNFDQSIQSLVHILNNLKQTQHVAEMPPQHHQEEIDYVDYNTNDDDKSNHQQQQQQQIPVPTVVNGDPNSGRPGIDYPALSEIPETSFNCKEQRYKGFFGDPETNCQVWHYCDLNGGQASFLCPNGTIFSQVALTCDWWFNVKCSTTTQLYVLNERLYKYILPFSPKFPEDYSGPLVDKYLAIKFQEMEEKLRKQKVKGKDTKKESRIVDDENPTTELTDENTTSAIEPKADANTNGQQNHQIENSHDVQQYDDEINTNQNTIGNDIVGSTVSYNVVATSTTSSISTKSSSAPVAAVTREPKVEVESEKVEVIEIKSDGSSGHLIPLQYQKY